MTKNRILIGVVAALVLVSISFILQGCADTKVSNLPVHKESVTVNNEVPRVGPYSQMIRSNGFVYCSAQVAFDGTTGKLIEGGVAEQTEQILNNFKAELGDAGLSLDDVVTATVYLKDMSKFEEMNAVYGKFFNDPCPVRTCVEVSDLPVKGAELSVSITAAERLE